MLLYDSAVTDANRLLPAIEALYGAALGVSTWTDALTRLGDAVGADHLLLQAQAATPFFASARIDERDLARALAVHQEVDLDLPAFDTVPDGSVVNRSFLMSDRQYARSAHYNEMIRPLGGFHGLLARLHAPAQGSSLVLCRTQRQGDFGTSESGLVSALLPHIAMAIDVHAMAARTDQTVRSLEILFEGVSEAVVTCDRWLRPLFANAAAMRLLAQADGIGSGSAGLFGATADDTRRLRAAIAAAGGIEARRLRLSRQSGRPPLMLRVVSARNLGLGAAASGSTVLFISEPDAARRIDRDALCEAFGLTRREADVAALLAHGQSTAAIAAELQLGIGSVRVYFTRIFDKTQVRSQAALVALICGFV
jgi:DNA-binding CsgD family transcriptional regulator